MKLPVELALINAILTTLNLRGVRESAVALAPVFVLFLITHLVLIVGTLGVHVPELPAVSTSIHQGLSGSLDQLGLSGLLLLLV